MRTIIAGSRTFGELQVAAAMRTCPWTPTVVLSGTARGVDLAGEKWAKAHNVSIERYPADWGKFGRGAGYVRNSQMASQADALVAVWDGMSRGTQHMIEVARMLGLRVHVWKTS